jgi:hypothetical protein
VFQLNPKAEGTEIGAARSEASALERGGRLEIEGEISKVKFER